MKKFIITTTINSPTEAIKKFDANPEWDLIVIGDKKTPKDYSLKNGLYISPDEQEQYDKNLSDAIGWNCIQRRNFGFLKAFDLGADIVATIDDDNIPLSNWGEEVYVTKTIDIDFYDTNSVAFDPLFVTNYKHLWHRGFPIQLINKRNFTKTQKKITVDIQADFWNGDPDVDAICRIEHAPECDFSKDIFPFASTKFSPFNSQNTFLSKKVLKDYFMFPYIGRMDDIWAAYYVESLNYKVAYGPPTVFQKRNNHDLIVDMKNEYIGYENNLKLLHDLKSSANNIYKYLPERSKDAFKLYQKHFR